MSDKYYVLRVIDDIEPVLDGPYLSEAGRDTQARRLRMESEDDGIFWLDINSLGNPIVGSYSSAFFDDLERCDSLSPQHDTEARKELEK